MATVLLAAADRCVGAGKGMATTWTLSGTATSYLGDLYTTDGYQIVATMTYTSTEAYLTNLANEALSGA